MKAFINFIDGSKLTVKQGDGLIPLFLYVNKEEKFATSGNVHIIDFHSSNGLIPDLMSFFLQYDYFYLSSDCFSVYNSKMIVSITSEN